MEVVNHKKIVVFQLWGFVNVFQFRCEYENGVPTLPLFFNLFGVQRKSVEDGVTYDVFPTIKEPACTYLNQNIIKFCHKDSYPK